MMFTDILENLGHVCIFSENIIVQSSLAYCPWLNSKDESKDYLELNEHNDSVLNGLLFKNILICIQGELLTLGYQFVNILKIRFSQFGLSCFIQSLFTTLLAMLMMPAHASLSITLVRIPSKVRVLNISYYHKSCSRNSASIIRKS